MATNVFADDQLPSDHAKLLDWDEAHQGFSFEYRDPAGSKMDFFIADRGKAGFKVTGQITSIELNDPETTVVLVDGEKVQEADTSGPLQGKSTGTVTLKHRGGEGSYEEGFDFSEGEVQRDGETGPDKPSLNPDFSIPEAGRGRFLPG